MINFLPSAASSILGSSSLADSVGSGASTPETNSSSASASFAKGDFIVTKSDSTLQIGLIVAGAIALLLFLPKKRGR